MFYLLCKAAPKTVAYFVQRGVKYFVGLLSNYVDDVQHIHSIGFYVDYDDQREVHTALLLET